MGERELREKYGGKLAKAINRAIRAEVPGGNEALDRLTDLAAAAKQSHWHDKQGRPTPEAEAYYKHQRDVIGRMEAASGIALSELKVDGGAAMNNFVLQFQADQLGVKVLRPKVIDTTARGAACLAGLAVGFWKDKADLRNAFALDREYLPSPDRAAADKRYRGWSRAVDRARDWAEQD